MKQRFRQFRNAALYYPFRLCLGLGSCFPLGLLRPLGRLLGLSALAVSGTNRRRAWAHLATAFPDLDDGARRTHLKAMAGHLGLLLAEVVWLWRARPHQVVQLCTISGLEHFLAARESGTGAVLVTAHCGNWEILNARLGAAGIPLTIAVREVFDRRLDLIASTLRARFGAEVVPRGPRAARGLLKALATNRVIGLLIDQDIHGIPGTFVPFFGRPAWTPSGAATLALRTGRPLIPAFAYRCSDGSHHAEVHPPLPVPTAGTAEEKVQELTAAATAAIERQVRAHPEQWVWMHLRWKTRKVLSRDE